MYQIGSHSIDSRFVLAPMAGITDLPFRELCLAFNAGAVTSEMVSSDTQLWSSRKSSERLRGLLFGTHEPKPFVLTNDAMKIIENFSGKVQQRIEDLRKKLEDRYRTSPPLRIVQVAGGDVQTLKNAAAMCEQHGADVIDINMGCPAKKVCKKAAGSALLKDETLVENILCGVRESVKVPVTLKTRTGWSKDLQNGFIAAELAEKTGINAVAIHGRTRECRFKGEAEYENIRAIKAARSIPIIANGDITSFAKANAVLRYTSADALMIGRGALGQPWVFSELLPSSEDNGIYSNIDEIEFRLAIACLHVNGIHKFYGEEKGVRIARKHFAWYIDAIFNSLLSDTHDALLRQNSPRTTENEKVQKSTSPNFKASTSSSSYEEKPCQSVEFCNTKFNSPTQLIRSGSTHETSLLKSPESPGSDSCDELTNLSPVNRHFTSESSCNNATNTHVKNATSSLLGNGAFDTDSTNMKCSKHNNNKVRQKEIRSTCSARKSPYSSQDVSGSHRVEDRLDNEFIVHQLRKTKRLFNSIESAQAQLDLIQECFYQLQFLITEEEIAA